MDRYSKANPSQIHMSKHLPIAQLSSQYLLHKESSETQYAQPTNPSYSPMHHQYRNLGEENVEPNRKKYISIEKVTPTHATRSHRQRLLKGNQNDQEQEPLTFQYSKDDDYLDQLSAVRIHNSNSHKKSSAKHYKPQAQELALENIRQEIKSLRKIVQRQQIRLSQQHEQMVLLREYIKQSSILVRDELLEQFGTRLKNYQSSQQTRIKKQLSSFDQSLQQRISGLQQEIQAKNTFSSTEPQNYMTISQHSHSNIQNSQAVYAQTSNLAKTLHNQFLKTQSEIQRLRLSCHKFESTIQSRLCSIHNQVQSQKNLHSSSIQSIKSQLAQQMHNSISSTKEELEQKISSIVTQYNWNFRFLQQQAQQAMHLLDKMLTLSQINSAGLQEMKENKMDMSMLKELVGYLRQRIKQGFLLNGELFGGIARQREPQSLRRTRQVLFTTI